MNSKHEKKHWYELNMFGLEIHPVVGILIGIIIKLLNNIFSYSNDSVVLRLIDFATPMSTLLIGISVIALIAMLTEKKTEEREPQEELSVLSKESKTHEAVEAPQEEKNEPKKESSMITKVIIIIAVLIGIGIGNFLGAVVLILYVPILLGQLFGTWYSKKTKTGWLISTIAWSNIFSWLLPPLGLLSASTTHAFSRNTEKKDKQKYTLLWIIGAFLSICNSILGIMQSV